jgi:hypothetical protein
MILGEDDREGLLLLGFAAGCIGLVLLNLQHTGCWA